MYIRAGCEVDKRNAHAHTGTRAVSSGAFNDRTRTASAGGDFRFIYSADLCFRPTISIVGEGGGW